MAPEIRAVKFENSKNVSFYQVKSKSHNFYQCFFKCPLKYKLTQYLIWKVSLMVQTYLVSKSLTVILHSKKTQLKTPCFISCMGLGCQNIFQIVYLCTHINTNKIHVSIFTNVVSNIYSKVRCKCPNNLKNRLKNCYWTFLSPNIWNNLL